MSYEVVIPPSSRAKIEGWGLPAYLLFRIEERLLYGDLAEHPNRHLQRLPPPADILQYSFRIADRETPPRNYLFIFDVVYAADEQRLVIRDCEYLCE